MSEHDCTTTPTNELTAGKLRELLYYSPETGVFTKIESGGRATCKPVGSLEASGYLRIQLFGRRYLSHTLAWLYVYGHWPVWPVTHLNGIKSDDRVDNLAYADTQRLLDPKDLTAKRLRELLNYSPDTGEFTRKVGTSTSSVGDVAGGLNNRGYVTMSVQGKSHQAHRLAWLYVHGVWPTDQLDHINRNKSDNRIANLRQANHSLNSQNKGKPKNNTSGFVGVYLQTNRAKWQASIRVNKRNMSLGYFSSLEEAVAARKAGELKYWGAHRAD